MIEDLDTPTLQMRSALDRLDRVAAYMETRWGIGRLESLAPADLRVKWERQREKLNVAIEENDKANVSALVEGSIRGWNALEGAAKAAGHVPYWPDVWEYHLGGRLYRVVKCPQDAQAAHRPDQKDVVVVTVDGLLRVFQDRYERAYGLDKKKEDLPEMPKEFWKSGGDTLDDI